MRRRTIQNTTRTAGISRITISWHRPAGHRRAERTGAFLQNPTDLLYRIFGHRAFRGRQEEVVRHVVAGGDAVVLFPTGAGKSLCYQLSALCREGTEIVISPLIALMRDQVEALRQSGVQAAAMHSGVDAAEMSRIPSGPPGRADRYALRHARADGRKRLS